MKSFSKLKLERLIQTQKPKKLTQHSEYNKNYNLPLAQPLALDRIHTKL